MAGTVEVEEPVEPSHRVRLRREPGALEAFEKRTAWPMLGVVLASLVLLFVPVFFTLPPLWSHAEVLAEWLLWLIFVGEYVTRWTIAMDRRTFVKHNLIDLAVVLLPMIPALRALRLARLLRFGVIGARVVDQSDSIVKRSNAKYAVMVAGLVVLLAAAMVWHVEHLNQGSSIHTLPDAIWWAVTTVTTVGYGDKYPITFEGKTIALFLMVIGIGIFGLVSATLASLFVEREAKDDNDDIREHMARLEAKLDLLLRAQEASNEKPAPS